MSTHEIKHRDNSPTIDLKKVDFFQKKVEEFVNRRAPLNLLTDTHNKQYIAQLYKITQKDLIADDGTQLAAFVEADEPLFESLPSKEPSIIIDSECVSRSWPPPLKGDSEGHHELLSSFEFV